MTRLHHLTRTLTLSIAIFTLISLALAQNAPARAGRGDRELRSQAGDQKPGSVLVYNYYTSSLANTATNDTEVNLTNTHADKAANVHLFFIDGPNGFILDMWVCLAPNQTTSFLTSTVDPEMTGYIIAIAVDQSGCPISFNHLIGSESVKQGVGRAASFNAVSFAALYEGRLPGCNAITTMTRLDLDGAMYDAAPRQLALDRIGSPADGNETTLIVNSLDANLATGAPALDEVTGMLFNDAGDPFNFRAGDVKSQLARKLSDDFPQTTPVFSQMIPRRRIGWLSVMGKGNRGITGAAINFNPNAFTPDPEPDPAKRLRRFNSSHNLHHVSYTNAKLEVPVFPVSCD